MSSTGRLRASSTVESVDASSTRMISSTTSRGMPVNVRSSVRAALRAGMKTMTLRPSNNARLDEGRADGAVGVGQHGGDPTGEGYRGP